MSMSAAIILPNAAYAGQTPRLLSAACHEMHVHESQIKGAPADAVIGTRCGCGHMVVFDAGQLQAGFTQMRTDGWIA